MNIDYAFIMCAGKGTRMGSIGKVLPKPLWPVFESNLLELQIIYAKALGAKEIYINSHHCHEQMLSAVDNLSKKYSDLNLSYEPTLLGSGGGIHQFCRNRNIHYQGTAIYLSGDQFLFFDQNQFKEIEKIYASKGSCLIANEITGNPGYNRTIFDNDFNLTKIESEYDYNKKSYTFSGMGFIKLDLLNPTEGISSFFDTVCNYKNREIGIYPLGEHEYWDFGTLQRYFSSCFKMFNNLSKKYQFFDYFPKTVFLDTAKVDEQNASYANEKKDKCLQFELLHEGIQKNLEVCDGAEKTITFDGMVEVIS